MTRRAAAAVGTCRSQLLRALIPHAPPPRSCPPIRGSDMRLQWSAKVEGSTEALTGTARIPHAAADELDELRLVEVEVTSAEAAADHRDMAQAAVARLLPELEACFRRLLELLVQK